MGGQLIINCIEVNLKHIMTNYEKIVWGENNQTAGVVTKSHQNIINAIGVRTKRNIYKES